ncbi:MAG: hypothetical protein AAF581_23630 [Planctomycetota bacterium]
MANPDPTDESAPTTTNSTSPLWKRGMWIGLGLVLVGAALQGYFAYGTDGGTTPQTTAVSWGLTGLGIVIYVVSRITGLWAQRTRA